MRRAIAVLVFLVAGWMIFDGIHALTTGDYVTPRSGEYAGQLGPWAAVLEGAGIAPRSAAVKVGFIVYGLVYLAFLARFLRHGAMRGLSICAVVGLFYLVAGTMVNAAVLVLLWVMSRRRRLA